MHVVGRPMHSSGRLPSLRPFAAALAAAVALLATSGDASAWCRSTTCRADATKGKDCPTDENSCPATGAKLFWPTSCVSYAVNKLGTESLDPGDTRDIIRKCFQSWSDVSCGEAGTASMTFQERDPVSCKKSEYNKAGPNLNVVLFQDADWKYRGIDGTLAKTSVTFNEETGEIYDADIEVNAANNDLTITDDPRKVSYDLQSILTHEVGHFVGIAHSASSDAVMFASYTPGSMALRALTEDDVKAVCAAYPPKSGIACNVEPRGGFSPTCGEEEEAKGLCSTSSVGAGSTASGSRIGCSAALAGLLGTVVVSAARRRRRSIAASGRRS